LHFFIH